MSSLRPRLERAPVSRQSRASRVLIGPDSTGFHQGRFRMDKRVQVPQRFQLLGAPAGARDDEPGAEQIK